MADIIRPPWAISVWSSSDHIFAELPATQGHQSHVVKLPNDITGFRKLLELARQRNGASKIGTKGDPTQWQIDKPSYDPAKVRRIGREKVNFSPQQRIGAREILRKLGMI